MNREEGWPQIGKIPIDRLEPAVAARRVTSISEVQPVSSWDFNHPSNSQWELGIRGNSKKLSDTIRLHFGQQDRRVWADRIVGEGSWKMSMVQIIRCSAEQLREWQMGNALKKKHCKKRYQIVSNNQQN
jgi:hypothetical protein